MFNSNLREFDEDPFFSDPFRAHNDHMRHMMRSFSEPFGWPVMPSLTDGRSMAGQPSSSQALSGQHRDMSRSLLPFGSMDSTDLMRNPFGMVDNMMANMRNRMQEMHRNIDNTASNSHSFSSSSVMTYSKVGNEPPKVFQASSSTRRAPGGIKETRRAVRDSESGLEQMSIGHHIQDRGHVVEKKLNKKTGEKELMQDFQNMDESEAQNFDEEWQQELSKFDPSGPMTRPGEPQLRGAQRAALPAPKQPNRERAKAKAVDKSNMKSSTKQ
ncbi:myeloid leukemia factor 1 [Scomber japonicus]|uniref:myeloid leukemia factor 1 n=1 Tax=Scomber japonicus TaxID=13676 RepID=UPI0023059D56|nr:myeloid leukemia factor 1 [Scomber japonicus]